MEHIHHHLHFLHVHYSDDATRAMNLFRDLQIYFIKFCELHCDKARGLHNDSIPDNSEPAKNRK